MKDPKATASHKFQSRSVALTMLDAVLIFIILLLTYTLTYSGSFRTDDEHILVARAQSLAFWDHIQYPQVYGNERVRHLSTILEDAASPVVAIEPGQAFFGSILFQFASAAGVGGVQAYFTLNLYATAITGALVYLSLHVLGYRRRTAILSAFIYGLGTMAWPYSKTAFRDPLAACMVMVAMLGWVMWNKEPKLERRVGLTIFIFGIIGSLFFKSNVIVLIPAFLISAVILDYQRRWSARIDKSWIIKGFLPFMLLIILSLFVSNPGPLSRLSISYYTESLSTDLGELDFDSILATLGPFFSPSKSLFLFNPIFLLIPWILIRYQRDLQHVILPTLLGAFFLAVIQALHLREHWAGTLVWGLRFMLPILPLFSILLAPWLEELISNGFNWKKGLAFGFIGLDVFIQLSGVIVAWQIPFKVWVEKGLDPYAIDSIWNLKYLVIPQHFLALFRISSWDVAWIRTSQMNWWALLIPILAISLISLVLISILKRNIVFGKYRSRSGLASSLLVFAICLPIFPSLWLLRMDPASGGGSDLEQALEWTKVEAREGDLIIVDSYGTKLWQRMMNDWDKDIAWYSLPYEIPGAGGIGSGAGENPSYTTLELFDKLGGEFSRLIYLTSQETPDFLLGREEGWLQAHYHLERETEFQGHTFVKATIFSP